MVRPAVRLWGVGRGVSSSSTLGEVRQCSICNRRAGRRVHVVLDNASRDIEGVARRGHAALLSSGLYKNQRSSLKLHCVGF